MSRRGFWFLEREKPAKYPTDVCEKMLDMLKNVVSIDSKKYNVFAARGSINKILS